MSNRESSKKNIQKDKKNTEGKKFYDAKKYGFSIQIGVAFQGSMRVIDLEDTKRIIKENERAIELFNKRDLTINELNELKNMYGVFLVDAFGRIKCHDNKMLWHVFIWNKRYQVYC